MDKPKKTKPELFLFAGFTMLSLSFLAIIWFYNEKITELNIKEKLIIAERIKLENEKLNSELIRNKITDTIALRKSIKISDSLNTASNIKISKINNSVSPIYVQVGSEEKRQELIEKNFNLRISKFGYNIIDEYDLEKNRADNTVRYFNLEDKILADKLCNDIKTEFKTINLKAMYINFSNIKVQSGQLEVWIKN
jgi:hypothetical protein